MPKFKKSYSLFQYEKPRRILFKNIKFAEMLDDGSVKVDMKNGKIYNFSNGKIFIETFYKYLNETKSIEGNHVNEKTL